MKGVRAHPLWHLLRTNPDTDACVEWQFTRFPLPRDYGQVRYEGKLWLAHRVSFLLHKGAIPDGLDVCHECDNPPCWNPRHLFTGTRKENMQDSKGKGRNFIPQGELSGRAVLDEATVIAIRAEYRPGVRGLGAKSLGDKYGVSKGAIQSILEGRNWRHI